MGFFPNIFKVPKSDIIPNIVTVGGFGITKGSLEAAAKVVGPAIGGIIGSVQGSPNQNVQTQRAGTYPYSAPAPYSVSYGAPSYNSASPFDPSPYNYAPAQSAYGGGNPWASSTPSFQPSTMPSQTYSAPRQDRSWEDLALTALPFFL
jgi:hypothetical protein